jgi:hypothetical protein
MIKTLLRYPYTKALTLGVCLTLFQILLACALAPGPTLEQAYRQLCQWDCFWYATITRDGYHSPYPPVSQNSDISNVAFFPGYPLLSRFLYLGLHIQPEISLILIAQIFCVIFWAAWWLLLKQFKIPLPIASLATLGVLSHPASFYLVSGYSESLFLSSLLLFLLYTSKTSKRKRSYATPLAGITMSATRIIGIPAAIFPILQLFSRAITNRKMPSMQDLLLSFTLSLTACLGAFAFLAYCQFRFGHYNMYMETQKIGWGIIPDYSALFHIRSFGFRFIFDRIATFASIYAFLIFSILELILININQSTGLKRRLPLYMISFLTFFITLSGLKSVQFQSMIRYTLPWSILLTLCLAHISLRIPQPPQPINYALICAITLGLSFFFYLFQISYLQNFLNGQWFA